MRGRNAALKTASWRAWWSLSRTELAVQRVMSWASVRWVWTVKDKMGALGREDREMRGVEVVKDSVRCDRVNFDGRGIGFVL